MKWNIFAIFMDLLLIIGLGVRLYGYFFLDEPSSTFRVVLDVLLVLYMAADLVHRIKIIRNK